MKAEEKELKIEKEGYKQKLKAFIQAKSKWAEERQELESRLKKNEEKYEEEVALWQKQFEVNLPHMTQL